eukprot:CAMPEP_0169077768 /NCGR_PEP_ID=MMETSP1015-20121227/9055_1 /TAXON_ID=342587 /ORGANISM="Karlodinium micrum, Strain CCMP2283" /LENGTH=139 /DNA_ID=CAMNT_0009137315 /DNA_START=276 /DNA_END=692 /DNA_ORIENTATION=-
MPECVGCLKSCGRLAALGGAAGAAIGGGAGQALGSMVGKKMNSGGDASATSGPASPTNMGAYSAIFDEWNTAPTFALLLQRAPFGIDQSIPKQRRRRFEEYFQTPNETSISGGLVPKRESENSDIQHFDKNGMPMECLI